MTETHCINKFTRIILAAKRAAQLNRGAKPLIPPEKLQVNYCNHANIAIAEILEGKIKMRFEE